MANETVITVIGNAVADPELRFTPSGAAVANFTVASTPRKFNQQTNQWEDQEALFLRCSAWRDLAENVAESITKGMRIIVTGRLKQRSYEDKSGERRTIVELDVDEVGPSLKYASAKVTKTSRSGGQQGGGFGGGGQRGGQTRQEGGFGGGGGGRQQATQQGGGDPWSQSSGGGQYDWGSGQDDEPPF